MGDKISCLVEVERSLGGDSDRGRSVLSDDEVRRLNAIQIRDYIPISVQGGPLSRGLQEGFRSYNN